jgi:hypothetical protein
MAKTGCGISHKSINANTTTKEQQRNKVMKPQTNTFSKYCEDNTKKV